MVAKYFIHLIIAENLFVDLSVDAEMERESGDTPHRLLEDWRTVEWHLRHHLDSYLGGESEQAF